MFAEGLTYIMMVWSSLQLIPSVKTTAILMIYFWLPGIVIGPFFGIIIDKFSYKHLLLIIIALKSLCLFGFYFFTLEHLSLQNIYLLSCIMGTLFTMYIPVLMILIRILVNPDTLVYANSTMDISRETGIFLGMGTAGVLLISMSLSTYFVFNGLCYALSFLLVLGISITKVSYKNIKNEPLHHNLPNIGLYILKLPDLLLTYIAQSLFFVCLMTSPVLLAPYVTLILHRDVTIYGFLEASLSIGIVVGGILSPWFSAKFTIIRVALTNTLLGIGAFCLFLNTENILLATFYYFLIGYSLSSWGLVTTLAQESTMLKIQGRIQSLSNSISGILMILFYCILIQFKDTNITLLYSGEIALLAIAGGILIYLSCKKV